MHTPTYLAGVYSSLQEASTHHVVCDSSLVYRWFIADPRVYDFHHCFLKHRRYVICTNSERTVWKGKKWINLISKSHAMYTGSTAGLGLLSSWNWIVISVFTNNLKLRSLQFGLLYEVAISDIEYGNKDISWGPTLSKYCSNFGVTNDQLGGGVG